MSEVILFYKYLYLENPEQVAQEQRALCSYLGLKGRILIADEGINGTLEGETQAISKYCEEMHSNPCFSDVKFKHSKGDGNTFRKLVVKVRNEVVTSSLPKNPKAPRVTGKYLTSEELHTWFEEGREFYIVDMRNDYEAAAGRFEGSILSGMGHFRDLPKILPNLMHLKDKTVVTVCTGGIRCEKASGFLVENGFSDVYQLLDGIHTYMEKYPNQHFKGKLYVFDKRILIGFNTESPEHQVIGRCLKCGGASENYINCANDECHLHFICCEECLANKGAFCLNNCVNATINYHNEKQTQLQ